MVELWVIEGPDNIWIKKDAGWWNQTKKNLGDVGRAIREKVNPSRMIGEKMFDSYHEQMEHLREVDDSIRAWTRDLDLCLQHVLKFNSHGKMLDVIYWISQINTRLKLVGDQTQYLSSLRDEQLEEFYGARNHPLQSDYFKHNEDNLVNPDEISDEMMATAGVLDNIGRWVTRRKMESMYKKRLAEQKLAIRTLISTIKSVIGQTDTYLGRMGKARASGNIESYINDLTKISNLQKNFENKFKELFNLHFKDMVGRLQAKEQIVSEEQEKQKEVVTPVEKPTLPSIHDPNDPVYGEPVDIKGVTQGPQGTIPNTPKPEVLNTWQLTPPVEEDVPINLVHKKEKPIPPEQLILPEPKQNIVTLEGTPESESVPEIKPLPKAELPKPVESLKPNKNKKPKVPKTTEANDLEMALLKNSHASFYKELDKAASSYQDPKLIACMILKYSEQIDDLDPDKSLELIAIAEGLLNG